MHANGQTWASRRGAIGRVPVRRGQDAVPARMSEGGRQEHTTAFPIPNATGAAEAHFNSEAWNGKGKHGLRNRGAAGVSRKKRVIETCLSLDVRGHH